VVFAFSDTPVCKRRSQTSIAPGGNAVPLNVLITIDTEVYPLDKDWRTDRLAKDIRRDIYGDTQRGSYGVLYQLDVFRRHGIKAVFFVEGLHASCSSVGISPLTELVHLIYSYGQEVQLHLHPEWVPYMSGVPVPDRGYLLTSYGEDEQYRLIDIAAQNLVKAGAKPPDTFRAGDYAANQNTLRALTRAGFRYDTSYNFPYLGGKCAIESEEPLWQPARLEPGIWEVPVSCFEDRKGHFRHCQLCACSSGEIKNSIRQASENSWQTYVMVSHSFEMLHNRRSTRPTWPRWQVIKRFEEECEWLANNPSVAVTSHFSDLNLVVSAGVSPLRGRAGEMIRRNFEQAADRITSRLTI
jgi:peptidoglycan/xylan/chitin deacetylase (PgdA/CDA1 family)